MEVHILGLVILPLCFIRELSGSEAIESGGYPSLSDRLVFTPLQASLSQPTHYTNEQRDIVNRLNAGRRDVSPTATNMLKVGWDGDLATAAANVLNSCFFSVSMPENINLLVDKNVIQATGITRNSSFYLPEALSFWLDYGKDVYVYDTFDCQAEDKIICKMYKLLTWSSMYKVGCSQRFCPLLFDSFSSNTEKNYIYWKCNFANIGRFWDDGYAYSTGDDPCTSCPDGKGLCYGGLCDNHCSTEDDDCYCALNTTCSSNGRFSENDCSCTCDAGYRGNSCQTRNHGVEEYNSPRSVLKGPFYSSSTPSASLVLATTPQVPTHSTVVGSFLANDAVLRREERDAHMVYTMNATTYEDDQSTETEPTTHDDDSTSVEPSTEDSADTTEDVTWASTTDQTTVYMSTEDEYTSSFYEETTLLWSTAVPSTDEPEETTAELSTLAVSSTEPYEESTAEGTTFRSTPERTSTDHDEETTEEEVTEPMTRPDEQGVPTTTDEATTTEEASSCTLSCGGGARLDEGACSCECDADGYTYNYTVSACLVCGYENPCTGSGVLDVNTCSCYCASGYQGPSCESVCNVTENDCWEEYSEPEEELEGDYCPTCCLYCDDCSEMTCANDGYADKIAGLEAEKGMCRCYCPLPWSGLNCDECNLDCLNGGSLNATTCSCQCQPGSTGINCSDPCLQTSLLCTENARAHCNQPLISKSCPQMCGICTVE